MFIKLIYNIKLTGVDFEYHDVGKNAVIYCN